MVPPIKSAHAQERFASQRAELESVLDRSTEEATESEISRHLIRLIDIFFALVLGQGILRFDHVLSAPWDSNAPVLLALLAVYYTVIRSFLAWHGAIEDRRYRINVKDRRTMELWRVYIDVIIVALYAFLLVAIEPLQDPTAASIQAGDHFEGGGADISAFFFALPVLFGLYLIWGALRRRAWGEDEFKLRVLVGFGLSFLLVAVLYKLDLGGISNMTRNIVGILVVLGLMSAYRYINFWQGRNDVKRWNGIPVLPRKNRYLD